MCGVLIFITNRFGLYPNYWKISTSYVIWWNIALLVSTYFVSAFAFSYYQATTFGYEFIPAHLLHPASINSTLPFLIGALIIGLVYTYFSHLIITKKFYILRKALAYSGTGILIASFALFLKYKFDVSYKGNPNIQFIEADFDSMEQIFQQPQFKGKVVYVDMWYSSCSPCLKQFKHTPALKQNLNPEEVVFLYLGRETSHPNSKQRWKNTIRKFNLNGWHYYMSKEKALTLWDKIIKNQSTLSPAGYPRYLLVNKAGEIIDYDAHKPSERDKVIAQIEDLVNS